jgi:LacI family transcriptional regulator
VDSSTASRALNEAASHLLSDDTVARVVKAAEDLGYQPNAIARSLRTSRTMTVGMLVPDIENPLFPPIVRGMEDELARSGYSVILANTDNDAGHERAVTQSLLARRIDGLAIASARLDHEGLEWLDDQSMPLVFVNRTEAEHDVPWVIPDDRVGTDALMEHLFDLGHTNIAQISGPQLLSTSRSRFQGYKRGLRRQGMKLDRSRLVFSDSFSIAGGAKACRELIDREGDFTAIFAGNDLIAIGCMETLLAEGLRIPEDVSVAGYNDLSLVDRLNPSLTTVRVPKYEMGVTAARLLLGRMKGEDEPEIHVRLETQLIVRQSTAPPP